MPKPPVDLTQPMMFLTCTHCGRKNLETAVESKRSDGLVNLWCGSCRRMSRDVPSTTAMAAA